MLGRRGWLKMGAWGLALVLMGQTGCMHFHDPIETVSPAQIRSCKATSQCQRNKVHVFMVNGFDPLDFGDFEELPTFLQSLGFIKTYCGYTYHTFHFLAEIGKLREKEPDTRIVLIGYGSGAGLVRDLAQSLNRKGIEVDLLVYLDGVEHREDPLDRPGNVGRVLNVIAWDRPDRARVEGAENVRLEQASHFELVMDPKTLCVLTRELTAVAQRVPIIEKELPPLPPEPRGPGSPPPSPPTLQPSLPTLPPPSNQTLPAPTPSATPPGTLTSREKPAASTTAQATPRPGVPAKPVAKPKRDEWSFLEPDGPNPSVSGAKPVPLAHGVDPATLPPPK